MNDLNEMKLNHIKLILWGLLISIPFSCIKNAKRTNETTSFSEQGNDSCRLQLYIGSNIESEIGCRNCHIKQDSARLSPKIPVFAEISAMDSLKLKDYIFKSKHNGMFLDLKSPNKKLDSLTECQIRNMIHYIKNYGRRIPQE